MAKRQRYLQETGLLNSAYIVISQDLSFTKDEDLKLKKIRCFNEFSFAVDRMIAGEYVDTEFEGKEISNEYLEYMHKNKTGALIRASVRIRRNFSRCKRRRT